MIAVQTPLRISLLGGGTDFEGFYRENGGAVLTTAIDKSVFVVVKERFDDKIYINYSKKEIVDRVEDIQHDLVMYAMMGAGVEKGVEITTLADVPSEGSGLGSSSSITVALLHALHSYCGVLVTAEQLAQEACCIEIGGMGKPIGRQDQYIAAYGGMRFIRFEADHVAVEDVKLSSEAKMLLNENLLLFYTGVTRSADRILAEQKGSIGDRVLELRKMKELAYEGRDALESGDFDRLGELLHYGWQLKKQLAGGVTNEAIDEMYDRALRFGAVGGKIAGAGGGGFLLLYCPHEKKNSIRRGLSDLRELPFAFASDGSRVIFNHRR